MSNIVDLFAERRKREIKEKADLLEKVVEDNTSETEEQQKQEQKQEEIKKPDSDYNFNEIMKENKNKNQKLDKERNHANEKVKRSYRLDKPKK